MQRVTLASYEMAMVRVVGRVRAESAVGGTPSFAYSGNGNDTSTGRHVQGAGGECAFAKGRGLYWPMSDKVYRTIPDVPPYEVRTTPKVAVSDPDDRPVAWISGGLASWLIRGWIMAGEAKERFPLTDPGGRGRPAHFVPEWAWRPFDDEDPTPPSGEDELLVFG